MNQRLIGYALLTAPILAIYGASPFYIFDKLSFNNFFQVVMGVSTMTFIFWALNILLITKTRLSDTYRYLTSYFGVFFSQFFFGELGRRIIPNSSIASISSVADYYIVYPIITTVAINTLILIICNSVFLAQKKKDADVEISKLKVEKLEAEKQVLMQQLQPHFLFNALSVLKSLIKENTDDAEEYTVKLSDFLRYSVRSHKSDVVTLREEIQFTNDYIELQKVRFDKSFIFETQIPNDILAHKIPVFALQTLVENAFKHNHFTEKRPLHIRITYEEKRLVIWNNKISIKITERLGTGLNNLNRRYEMITNKPVAVTDNEDFFMVKIGLIQEEDD
jgi:two-component system, LytTR family, sensor kinase